VTVPVAANPGTLGAHLSVCFNTTPVPGTCKRNVLLARCGFYLNSSG
jgi:hypothetical protein